MFLTPDLGQAQLTCEKGGLKDLLSRVLTLVSNFTFKRILDGIGL